MLLDCLDCVNSALRFQTLQRYPSLSAQTCFVCDDRPKNQTQKDMMTKKSPLMFISVHKYIFTACVFFLSFFSNTTYVLQFQCVLPFSIICCCFPEFLDRIKDLDDSAASDTLCRKLIGFGLFIY